MKSSFAPGRVRVWHALTFSALLGGAACGSDDTPAPMSDGSSGTGSDRPDAGAANAGAPSDSPNGEGGAGSNAMGGAEHASGGGAESGGANEAGGAPGIPGEGPPNVGGDPGLMVDPCESDAAAEPATFQGVCSANAQWHDAQPLALDTMDPPSLVVITPDELSVVWTETPSSIPTYFTSERATPDAAFVVARELPFTSVLALSPDGRRLTVRTNDGSLAEASRPDRDSEFGDAEAGAYAALEADAKARHLRLSDLVISPDDKSLYYAAWSLEAQTTYPLRVSSRTAGEEWPVGVPLEGCGFKAYGAFGPRPTGVSSDGLTLFYYDAARGTARAAFRATPNTPFGWFSDFPDHLRPQPNASCDRLYYSPRSGAASVLGAARK
jgi:hypothetical protein